MSSEAAENPIKAVKDAFGDAYSPDGDADVRSVGQPGDNSEMIHGEQNNGTPIGVFRPVVGAVGGSGERGATQVFSIILGDPLSGETSEFVVGGSEDRPYGFEVLSREPFRPRDLDEAEMANLARKIGRSTFH